MADAPQVQTLAQVLADLNPAYSGQEAVNTAQQAAVPVKYAAQKTALGAEKVQGFNDINNSATGRGASFSGIPVDEQATYLATKYLPGLQAADAAQNADQLTLQGEAAKLNTEKTTNALGIVKGQQSDLNQWNLSQLQIEAAAREGAANRAATAANAAADRQATLDANAGPTPNQYLINAFGDAATATLAAGAAPDAWKKNGYTESNIIGQYAASYGLNYGDAAKQVYAFRKQYYQF